MKPRNLTCPLKGLAPLLSACWFVPTLAHCQGSIVYVNPPDHQMISRGEISRFHDIDMNGDGMTDFVFRADSSFSVFSATGSRSIAIPQGGFCRYR